MQPGQASISHGLLCQQTDSVSPYVYVFLLSWMRSVDQRFAIAGGGETSGVRHVDRGPQTKDLRPRMQSRLVLRPNRDQVAIKLSPQRRLIPVGHQLVATWLQLRPGPNRIDRNLTMASLASQRDDTPNECRRHSVSTPSRDACDGSLSAMSCVNSGARFGTVNTFKARST